MRDGISQVVPRSLAAVIPDRVVGYRLTEDLDEINVEIAHLRAYAKRINARITALRKIAKRLATPTADTTPSSNEPEAA